MSRTTVAAGERIDRLVAGKTYRRRSLHANGLGADLRKGISYPARGGPALLFSGTGHAEWGYRDGWDGGEYRYFGEWPRGGGGDMVLTAGNAAILQRSPDLYLFTQVAPSLYRFEGRFASIGHTQEPVSAFGHTRLAIVFRLKREADVVELAHGAAATLKRHQVTGAAARTGRATVTLYELAWACRLYGPMAGFDVTPRRVPVGRPRPCSMYASQHTGKHCSAG